MLFANPLVALLVAAVAFATPLEKRAWPRGNVTCGSNVYMLSQVMSAVSRGYALRNAPIGSNSYPHKFNNYEGVELYCTGKTSWLEFPILRSGVYAGASPGADRVIFATDGTYCATLTHTGASGNNFVECAGD